MFGGYGLYCDGTFFGIVYDDRVYFKTDPVSAGAYLDKGMRPFAPNARQRLRNFHEVPPDVADDGEQLVTWARGALRASG
jgi:DNA transformation protein